MFLPLFQTSRADAPGCFSTVGKPVRAINSFPHRGSRSCDRCDRSYGSRKPGRLYRSCRCPVCFVWQAIGQCAQSDLTLFDTPDAHPRMGAVR
jgi:hypothetical protein